jgi:hypothetical protein
VRKNRQKYQFLILLKKTDFLDAHFVASCHRVAESWSNAPMMASADPVVGAAAGISAGLLTPYAAHLRAALQVNQRA